MSERKVLSKYYPPDFDPAVLTKRDRSRRQDGPKRIPVRLMAPFSMRCNSCGNFIYKGRKFNAQKEITDMKYYNITIYRFYIRCPSCSSEIRFRTDPKHMDYECEHGAQRNFEPWRAAKLAEETEEERLDRLEREEAEYDPMKELDAKRLDEETNMRVADALDEIRSRNAHTERQMTKENSEGSKLVGKTEKELQREAEDAEDAEIAHQAFSKIHKMVEEEQMEEEVEEEVKKEAKEEVKEAAKEEARVTHEIPPKTNEWTIRRQKTKKKPDFAAKLRIKPKA